MFHCPKCMNMYSITKTVNTKETQLGGSSRLENIVNNILDNNHEKLSDETNLVEEDLDNLIKLEVYKKLPNKQKDYVYNFINDKITKSHKTVKSQKLDSSSIGFTQNMFFKCENCGNNEIINDKTLILSRESTQVKEVDPTFNPQEYLHMNILPHTRQYNCVNTKCVSHTDLNKKSAIFMRLNDSYKVRYICEACTTSWIIK